MSIRALLLILCFLASPAVAQGSGEEQGRDLMGEALRLFMRGLMQEVGPALEEMEDFLGGLDAYHPPEVLPNGDIIIRRKQPGDPLADGETEI